MVAVLIRHFHEAAGGSLGSQISSCRPASGILGEGRFGIEKIGTEWATVHKKVDDAFCPGTEMRAFQKSAILTERGDHTQRAQSTADGSESVTPC